MCILLYHELRMMLYCTHYSAQVTADQLMRIRCCIMLLLIHHDYDVTMVTDDDDEDTDNTMKM